MSENDTNADGFAGEAIGVIIKQHDPEPIVVDLAPCTRCNYSHRGCKFEPLTRQNEKFTHWFSCPITGEPVMLSFNVPPAPELKEE